ncbi:hypothetical protein [Chroococcidiopsis sp.]|uniref:hypothetical protein n=1 Tax=Chroococcidiopsis sp. TaxID=3088168 RepID=UPI003F3DFF13
MTQRKAQLLAVLEKHYSKSACQIAKEVGIKDSYAREILNELYAAGIAIAEEKNKVRYWHSV